MRFALGWLVGSGLGVLEELEVLEVLEVVVGVGVEELEEIGMVAKNGWLEHTVLAGGKWLEGSGLVSRELRLGFHHEGSTKRSKDLVVEGLVEVVVGEVVEEQVVWSIVKKHIEDSLNEGLGQPPKIEEVLVK